MEGGRGVVNSPKFLYIIFLKVFTEKKMSFILTFLQMSNFVKFAILNDITSPPLMQRLSLVS